MSERQCKKEMREKNDGYKKRKQEAIDEKNRRWG